VALLVAHARSSGQAADHRVHGTASTSSKWSHGPPLVRGLTRVGWIEGADRDEYRGGGTQRRLRSSRPNSSGSRGGIHILGGGKARPPPQKSKQPRRSRSCFAMGWGPSWSGMVASLARQRAATSRPSIQRAILPASASELLARFSRLSVGWRILAMSAIRLRCWKCARL